MSYRTNLLTRLDRSFPSVAVAGPVAMLLLVLSLGASAVTAPPCAFSDAEFDFTNDVHALAGLQELRATLAWRTGYHSARNALSGSTFAARRAGMRLATMATNATPHTAKE